MNELQNDASARYIAAHDALRDAADVPTPQPGTGCVTRVSCSTCLSNHVYYEPQMEGRYRNVGHTLSRSALASYRKLMPMLHTLNIAAALSRIWPFHLLCTLHTKNAVQPQGILGTHRWRALWVTSYALRQGSLHTTVQTTACIVPRALHRRTSASRSRQTCEPRGTESCRRGLGPTRRDRSRPHAGSYWGTTIECSAR